MSKMILSLSLFATCVLLSLSSYANSGEASQTSSKAIEGCEGFTSEQVNKDPNAPCFAAIRSDLNEKDAVGIYYDAQLVSNPRDESGGKHVQNGILPADTNNNTYNMPFLKSAIPQLGSESQQDSGNDQSGTD